MRRVLPLLVLAAAIPTARAADVVDLQIGFTDRVQGTLRPADDRESFLVAALRGSAVRATVRRKGASEIVPTVELVDAGLAVIAAGSPTTTGAKLRASALPSSGDHRFRVTGNGSDGDYRLDVSVAPQRTWTGASDADLAASAEAAFTFAAPAGATASIDLRAAKGSSFRARLLDVTDSRGHVEAVDPPAETTPRHRAVVVLGAGGEHTVRFHNDGALPGAWTISVRLRIPAAQRTTVDLRDDSLAGEFNGTQAIVGRVAGGAEEVTIAGDLNLAGTSITVPAGALATPAVISMVESTPFFVSDARFAAGTTVSFQPSGTTFATAASVTIPIDLDAFDDPAGNPGELTIVVQDPETGEQQTIAATSVDVVNGTATFPVSHFSRFQPTSPNPRPLRGSFADLEITARTLPGYGAEITYGRNGVIAGTKQGLGSYRLAAAARTLRRMTIAWSLDEERKPRFAAGYDEQIGLQATVGATTDETVEVRAGDGSTTLDRGRGSEALSAVESVPEGLRFHAMMRRARGVPQKGNLAGAWHGSVFEVEARRRDDGKVEILLAGHDLELTVGPDGRTTTTLSDLHVIAQRFPDLGWRDTHVARPLAAGTLTPDAGEAVLRLGVGASKLLPAETRLVPVLRGDALVGGANVVTGAPGTPTGAAFRIVVLVRHASGASAASLPENALFSTFAIRPEPGNALPATLRFDTLRGALTFAEGGAASLDAVRRSLLHDAAGLATSAQAPLAAQGTAQLTPDGRYVAGKSLPKGLLTPGQGALFLFAPGSQGISLGVALPARAPTTK
jgi:hypothetical protein